VQAVWVMLWQKCGREAVHQTVSLLLIKEWVTGNRDQRLWWKRLRSTSWRTLEPGCLLFLSLSCANFSLFSIFMSQLGRNPMLLSPALLHHHWTINNQRLTLKADPSSSDVTEEFGFLELITVSSFVIKLCPNFDWQPENLLSLSHVGWMLNHGSTWDFNKRTTAAHSENPDLTWLMDSTDSLFPQTKENIIALLMGWTVCTT